MEKESDFMGKKKIFTKTELQKLTAEEIIEKIQHEILEKPITVYNFEVED